MDDLKLFKHDYSFKGLFMLYYIRPMILQPYLHVVFSRFKLLLVQGERGLNPHGLLQEYFSFRKGLVTGIIAAGFGFGAAVFSPLQTFIINPGKRGGISLDMGILFH